MTSDQPGDISPPVVVDVPGVDNATVPVYDASAITVLEGLEAVRKRPGMYIGSTGERGLHHLVYEVVDNSVDEALAGYCDTIHVALLPDGGIRVIDNGRGIPVKDHPTEKIPAVTVALTVLHAGRQVRQRRLQGVRRSARRRRLGGQRAVRSHLIVEVKRDGYRWSQSFSLGTPDGPLEQHEATDETGTMVTFYASPEIFETTTYSYETIATRFREYAFLNKGLRSSCATSALPPESTRRGRRDGTDSVDGGPDEIAARTVHRAASATTTA